MKFKELIISFIFGLIPFYAYSQIDSLPQKRKLYFYTYGLPAFDEGVNYACKSKLQNHYGFDKKIKAGCMVKKRQARRWKRHNERVDNKLQKTHGKNWREEYEKALKECKK